MIASLAGLEEDAELKALLQRRESEKTRCKEQLRSTKVLRIRRHLAATAREKAERHVTGLLEDISALRHLVGLREMELAEGRSDVEANSIEVAEFAA